MVHDAFIQLHEQVWKGQIIKQIDELPLKPRIKGKEPEIGIFKGDD